MNQSRLNVRAGMLFPWHFLFIGVVILLAGVFLLIERPLIGIILVVASGFILSASSGTEIDKTKNAYREYMSFYFLLKNGKWKKFTGAEKVFINSSKVSSTVYTAQTSHSAVFTNQEYNVYLKLLDGTKIHLLNSRKKEKLAVTANETASFLNILIQDNTIG